MASSGDGVAGRDQTSELQLLVDSAPALIDTGRPDGYLDFFNQAWLRYVGRPPEDLQGWKWTAFIHPEDVEGIVEKWRASLASGEPFLYDARVLRADGEYRWMLHHKVPVRDGCGQIVKWYGSSIDIEDRKRAEVPLRPSADELQRSEFYPANGQRLAHRGTGLHVNGATQEDPRLEAQLQATLNVIPAYTWYALPSGALTFVNERHADYLGLPKDHPLRFGIDVGAEWDSHLSLVHPDDHAEMRRAWSHCLGTGCSGVVSFRARNAEGGYRWFLSRVEPLRASDGTLLYWIGVTLDINERKQAEFYLAEGQRLAHMGSWAFSAAGFGYWSSELFRIYGLDPSGKPPTVAEYMDLVHPEDRGFVGQTIQKMLAARCGFDFTKRIVRRDGAIRSVRCVGIPATQGETFLGFVGTGMDVTEQELLTQELQRREAYLAEAQRLSHTGSWAWSPEQDIRYWSDECYRVLSFDPKDGLPRFEDFFQRLHPDDQPSLREVMQTAIREKAEWETDYRIVHQDGRVRDIHVVGHPVLSASGQLVEFVGTVIDVTERKRAEEERRRNEMELRQMLDLSPQHLAVLAPLGKPLYANRAVLEYFGIDLDQWRDEKTRLHLVHPDDRELFLREREKGLIEGTPQEFEARLRRHDGTFRWFLCRRNPIRDEGGRVTRWYSSAIDIDDRKQAQDKLQQENVALREEIDKASMFEEIVGTSESLKAALSRIAKVGPTDSTVLITGETGTGKELIARAVHKRSQRSGHPFVSVNCAALPPTLVSSELFGHEKGAFTGATQRRLGRFEMADSGTIFLDEVGELLPDTQAALLRVLQEREFERVGGGQAVRVDVRVIAATNRDLNAAVANGTFRQDLLYRLNVFPIEVPPLRDRKDDILILVEYFVQRYANRAGKNIRSIDQKTLDLLQSYEWPGNIRELQNVIERSIILSSADVFSVDEMWLSRRRSLQTFRVEVSPVSKPAARSEKEAIEAALAETRGRVSGPSGAAVKLGMAPSTLENRIKALKVDKGRYKYG